MPHAIPDHRLNLLFVCAHPAIDPAIQAPLMLQAVLGLDAARIAASFLVAPSAMGSAWCAPRPRSATPASPSPCPKSTTCPPGSTPCSTRSTPPTAPLGTTPSPPTPRHQGLAGEAIWLARLLVALLPDAPEAKGLLALMLYSEARRPARRDPAGRFVPLAQQDTSLWSATMIAEAEALLREAAALGAPGRLQTEAAIQSVHARRAVTGTTHWPAILALYAALERMAPSTGVRVAYAAALAEAGDPRAALALLDTIVAETYQPWWGASRARALHLIGRHSEAALAYTTAAGLSDDPEVRTYLLAQIAPMGTA